MPFMLELEEQFKSYTQVRGKVQAMNEATKITFNLLVFRV